MAQKLLTPLKKLPQHIQNLPIFQKLQDFTTGRSTGALTCHCASVYGIMEHPVSLAYDQDLCLLAVAYAHGHIEVYGMPGLSFPVDCVVEDIKFMEFIRNEGRLLLATSSSLIIVELNATSGHWERKHSVTLPFAPDESITAFAIGKGVVYIGSSAGTLRQVAIENGNMTVGDDDLTSLPSLLILNKLPEDKRDDLKLNTPIVSIELHPNGEELLLGYAGGTAVVTQSQSIPLVSLASVTSNVESVSPATAEKQEESEPERKQKETAEAETENTKKPEGDIPSPKKSKTGERHATPNLQSIRAQATKKFRTLSRTIKNKIDHSGEEKVDLPTLPVPPSPRVVRLLPYTQALCCATWRITPAVLAGEADNSQEVLIAYDDGGYLIWTIPKSDSEVDEPVIGENREVASVPYGPLPCAAIQRIIARPSVSGGVITAFVGGLPRAQHAEKHTISVLGGVEEHICFQFGSPIRDFVVLPSKLQQPQCRADESEPKNEGSSEKDNAVEDHKHLSEPSKPTDAGYLLVLTDRELVAINLTQRSWPAISSPYLKHLDCTGITAVDHIAIPEKLMTRLKEASNCDGFNHWPIIGGRKGDSCAAVAQHPEFYDLVAIAHADADVSLWHVNRGDCFEFLGRIPSLSMMSDSGEVGCHVERKNEEEAWPPFRKVGDCICEVGEGALDSRCAVRTLSLQLVSDEIVLLIGGNAGNFSMWTTGELGKTFEPDLSMISVDLLDDLTDKFSWEGHEAFKPIEGVFTPCPISTSGFNLCEIVQFNPPSAITAVAFEPRWEALAIGSAHGFALIDLKSRTVVHKRLTHDLQINSELTAPSVAREAAIKIKAGGRHLKETLRESFRKIRKIRSHSTVQTEEASENRKPASTTNEVPKDDEFDATATGVVDEALIAATEKSANAEANSEATTSSKPTAGTIEEKELESTTCHQLKPTDTTSGVSALALFETYVVPGFAVTPKENRPTLPSPRTASLIVGTQSGVLITHSLAWPMVNGSIEVKPVKEVRFQHGASILSILALDVKAHCAPVTSEKTRSVPEVVPEPPEIVRRESENSKPLEVEENGTKPTTTETTENVEATETESVKVNHELLVCTEEQVRVIALPSLKTKHKYRFGENSAASIAGTLLPSALIHRPKSEQSENSTNTPNSHVEVDNNAAAPETAETKETVAATPVAPVATPEADSTEHLEKSKESSSVTPAISTCQTTSASSLRRVAAFGLQRFPQASNATTEEWHAVIALKNGRIHVLTIPALRRILKATCCEHVECCSTKSMPPKGLTNACVSSFGNLTFWPFAGCMLVANEITYTTPCRLTSLVHVSGLKATGDAAYCVCLPEWARPKPPLAPVNVNAASVAAEENASTVANGTENLHSEKTEGPVADPLSEVKEELKGTIADPTESADTAKDVDNFTKDITKGIIADGSGTVTVKTTESSLEKHTVIEGGNVLTTVHETERVDGEVVKDDIVQVKSDVDESTPAITAGTEVTA